MLRDINTMITLDKVQHTNHLLAEIYKLAAKTLELIEVAELVDLMIGLTQ
jgi:hypothetical protein